jgi:segregation and condensation protein B
MSEPATPPEAPPPPLRIVEALLFVGGPPLTTERAGEIVRNLPAEQFGKIIDDLNRAYRRQGRPYVIQTGENGYTLTLKPWFRAVQARLAASPREARLTPAARDVLAMIAYRQPVSRADIDSQRGADSRGPLQQLVRLGLVAVTRDPDDVDNDVAYVTTSRFLELVGLRSLEDLPQTGDLQRL